MTDAQEPPSMSVAGHPFKSPITRRQFLTGSAAVSLAAVMADKSGAMDALMRDVGIESANVTNATSSTFNLSVARDADMALLDFTFYNFKQSTNTKGQIQLKPLTSKVALIEGIITVRFPPQAIGEAAYPFNPGSPPWAVDPPPVLSAMSGPSLLCFTIPSSSAVTFTTNKAADLLNWTGWTLLVPQVASSTLPMPSSYTPSDPTKSSSPVTYIEYPYGLYLSPTVSPAGAATPFATTFSGRLQPVQGAPGSYDIWTATLQQFVGSLASPLVPQVAATYSVDYTGSSVTDQYTQIGY